MSLLNKVRTEKVKDSIEKTDYSKQESAETVIAWFERDITPTQISRALKLKSSSTVYPLLARWARQAFKDGYIVKK